MLNTRAIAVIALACVAMSLLWWWPTNTATLRPSEVEAQQGSSDRAVGEAQESEHRVPQRTQTGTADKQNVESKESTKTSGPVIVGVVLDVDGEPIPEAKVRLVGSQDGQPVWDEVPWAESHSVDPSTGEFQLVPSGLTELYAVIATFEGNLAFRGEVRPPAYVELRMAATHLVTGRVVSGSGEAAESARVAFLDLEHPWKERPPLYAHTMADGSFECAVPAGRYGLAVAHPEGWYRSSLPIKISEATDLGELVLHAPAALLVHVVGYPNGEPLAESQVNLRSQVESDSPWQERLFATDAMVDLRAQSEEGKGTFRFTGLPPGRYLIRASAKLRTQKTLELELERGDVVEKTFALAPSGALHVSVVDRHGEAVPGLELALVRDEPRARPTRGLTDGAGLASFHMLAPGSYNLYWKDKRRQLWLANYVLAEGDNERQLVWELLSGIVVRAVRDAVPVSDVSILLSQVAASTSEGTDSKGNFMSSPIQVSDQAGLVHLPVMAPGDYIARGWTSQGQVWQVPVSLTFTDQVVELSCSQTRLSGRVFPDGGDSELRLLLVHSGGQALEHSEADARGPLLRPEGATQPGEVGWHGASTLVTVRHVQVDERGEFELTDCAPGVYFMAAIAPDGRWTDVQRFEMGSADLDGLELELRPSSKIEFQVTDIHLALEGRPREAVRAQVRRLADGALVESLPLESGVCTAGYLSAGVYKVQIEVTWFAGVGRTSGKELLDEFEIQLEEGQVVPVAWKGHRDVR